MRRLTAALVLALALLVGMATAAFADSAHFLFANSSISSSSGALNVDFKEAGLGTTVTTEQVTLTVDSATAVYQCFNNGGNHPKAGNKETVQTSLTTTGTFPVRNGQTTGTISAGPPSQGDFTCPSGQSLFLQEVTYSGITVTGAAGDSLGAAPDPISSGPIHLPV
jgi:acyl-coenzyme A thioesterase PaaI-like protein